MTSRVPARSNGLDVGKELRSNSIELKMVVTAGLGWHGPMRAIMLMGRGLEDAATISRLPLRSGISSALIISDHGGWVCLT
jgi:hypothetical protein